MEIQQQAKNSRTHNEKFISIAARVKHSFGKGSNVRGWKMGKHFPSRFDDSIFTLLYYFSIRLG